MLFFRFSRLSDLLVQCHGVNTLIFGLSFSHPITPFQEQAVKQIPEISQVLNYIPRQLILILKTNDLLRGIECMFCPVDI